MYPGKYAFLISGRLEMVLSPQEANRKCQIWFPVAKGHDSKPVSLIRKSDRDNLGIIFLISSAVFVENVLS